VAGVCLVHLIRLVTVFNLVLVDVVIALSEKHLVNDLPNIRAVTWHFSILSAAWKDRTALGTASGSSHAAVMTAVGNVDSYWPSRNNGMNALTRVSSE
jgi:hypothetical protein